MVSVSTRRRARYGVDAPGALVGLTAGAGVALVLAGLALEVGWTFFWLPLASGIYCALSAGSFVFTTVRGKFAVWASELDRLGLTGTEHILDLGCGRGAVLIMAAKRLSTGKVTGIDLWRSVDQSGNTEASARTNAVLEGVAERVELVTGDMRKLPFDDGGFDVVVSSLALHNINGADGRAQAVHEAFRVLKPSGRLLLADFRNTVDYAATVRAAGAVDVTVRGLGWRFWYGGPFFATRVVTALKPATPIAGPGMDDRRSAESSANGS